MAVADRFDQLLDPGSWSPITIATTLRDPLGFVDSRSYTDRHADAVQATGHSCGIVAVRGTLNQVPLVVAVMDFAFMGGSLGSAEGEMVATAAEVALREGRPLVVVTASGGARMQEGALALMQMAKTAHAFHRLDRAGIATITVISDPTFGGVAASFASLADIIIAEPRARMGFAGPRVIKDTIGQDLPAGFQSSESLLRCGVVDLIVERAELRTTVARLLVWATTIADPARTQPNGQPYWTDKDDLPTSLHQMTPAESVKRARDLNRPTMLEHADSWLDGFTELHGDRAGSDCSAIVAGVGGLRGQPIAIVGHQKAHNTADLVKRNFGMASPAGFRKANRIFRLASKWGLPVVSLIDTPGAFPGVEAEENGQSVAIAQSIQQMGTLPVPVVAVITGEGGSGGALALGVANTVLMCENSIYSVISPEGCAAILWKSSNHAETAAQMLRLQPAQLLELGVIDGVIAESDEPTDRAELTRRVGNAVAAAIHELSASSTKDWAGDRARRFRHFGLADPSPVKTETHNDG